MRITPHIWLSLALLGTLVGCRAAERVERYDDKATGDYVIVRGEFSREPDKLSTGEQRKFYKDGSLCELSNWQDGKQHGHYEFRYPGGQLGLQGTFQNGKPVGEWVEYSQNGSEKLRWVQ